MIRQGMVRRIPSNSKPNMKGGISMNVKSRENKLRKLADSKGYKLCKGYVGYMNQGWGLYHDENGNKEVGYSLIDLSANTFVWGCYNEIFYNLWNIDEVEEFLKTA